MIAYSCDYPKPLIVHLMWVNCMLHELYLNMTPFKNKGTECEVYGNTLYCFHNFSVTSKLFAVSWKLNVPSSSGDKGWSPGLCNWEVVEALRGGT
jgi:hypothetical protein